MSPQCVALCRGFQCAGDVSPRARAAKLSAIRWVRTGCAIATTSSASGARRPWSIARARTVSISACAARDAAHSANSSDLGFDLELTASYVKGGPQGLVNHTVFAGEAAGVVVHRYDPAEEGFVIAREPGSSPGRSVNSLM